MPRRNPVIATAGARWVESSAEERPTTQTIYQAVWGGDWDALDAGQRQDAIEGEAEIPDDGDGDCLGLPAGGDD